MKDYITYIEEQLKIFRKDVNVIDESINEVTPLLLNTSLAIYTVVSSALNAEYQRKKKELRTVNNNFQSWWDEKYIITRRRLNPDSAPKAKWLSKGEIESELRYEYKKEYLEWRNTLDDLEMSKSFVLRLLGQWDTHSKILNTLSYNMQSELKALELGEMSSRPYAPVETKPIRKKKE